ncbi:glycoside hydrolase [Boeremia exigua]|uniref:glycoside hydrolase n=1 Tax=Boeremia exigua TaxID=749465 RepID=UPI001E8CAA98|nr:glycoside hydrolase [Boeremia exigua]KAH6633514.1 glycoside hydrolase [Boeremia exigua]
MLRPAVWLLAAAVLRAGGLATATAIAPAPRNATSNATANAGYGPSAQRAQAVVDTFRTSWAAYYEYAFPDDELRPVTNGSGNSRNGWGASAVDALSTALLMREQQTVAQILAHIPTIDWAHTSTPVSLFETTIRYLGGLLSGYDLLSGPLSHLADDPALVAALLDQSVHLANNLSFAFDTPSGVPYNTLNLSARTPVREPNSLATTGTLILEWTRLSDLTRNTTYAALANAAEAFLLVPSPPEAQPWPGLLGMYIEPTTGEFLDAFGGWVGGADSFYEYLLKTWIYDPERFGLLRERWQAAADSSIAHLASHPESRPELTFLAVFNGTQRLLQSQHLACFAGGNFLLGAQTLGVDAYRDFGLALVDGCHATYNATATRIGPESFGWDPALVPAGQEPFFARHGFYILDASYNLRPEVVEGYYYAWRATGDERYREWAWDAFVAINGTARAGSAWSSVRDVDQVGGGGATDTMESFWFAEVLKYCYLIFADGDDEWQVGGGGRDRWVWNTEGHPLRVYEREGVGGVV